jgi:hypothetical protein
MDYLKYIAIYVAIVLMIWGAGVVFAKSVSDYEVINPKDGIQCVVVSRMFNTSVDCWKD